jgi:hypothetical protein
MLVNLNYKSKSAYFNICGYGQESKIVNKLLNLPLACFASLV